MISILLALLAALGGYLVVPSNVLGTTPVAVTSGPVSGGMHTSDVSGGPTGHS
jgi:hypothetical protein